MSCILQFVVCWAHGFAILCILLPAIAELAAPVLICEPTLQDSKSDRPFGFVNYEDHEAAAAAKEALHEKEMEGRKLYVDRAQTKAERSDLLKRRYEQRRTAMAQELQGKNVYVKNLSSAIDEAALKEAFKVRLCSVWGGVGCEGCDAVSVQSLYTLCPAVL